MEQAKPMFAVNVGNETRIEVYGGYKEIGGNCIAILDRDKKIIFDNGIRFWILRKFYRGRVTPLGSGELRSIGAIPPTEVFDGAEALYISHLHLDHVGLLGPLPSGLTIKVPSYKMLEVLSKWYERTTTWLRDLPPNIGATVREVETLRSDENDIIAIPISHSAYPSVAFVYQGSEVTIFYSGDLRLDPPVHGLIGCNIEEVLQDLGVSVDVAIIEGTNIGLSDTIFLGPTEFKLALTSIALDAELLLLSLDSMDLEALMTILLIGDEIGRDVVIASHRIMDMFSVYAERILDKGVKAPLYAIETGKPPPLPIDSISIREDVLKEPNRYILIQDPVCLLEMLRKIRLWDEKSDLVGSIAIFTDPEPKEVKEIEEEVIRRWLCMFGITPMRLTLSGHYPPYHFGRLMRILKPRVLIPVHTRFPDVLCKLHARYTHSARN